MGAPQITGGAYGNGDKFNFPGYPPDKQEKATQTVLEQAQLLALDRVA